MVSRFPWIGCGARWRVPHEPLRRPMLKMSHALQPATPCLGYLLQPSPQAILHQTAAIFLWPYSLCLPLSVCILNQDREIMGRLEGRGIGVATSGGIEGARPEDGTKRAFILPHQ
jgi:hypothetical protein